MIRRLTRAGASALLAFGGVAAAVGLTRGAEQPAYTLRSAATDSVILKGLRWRSLGPDRGGRSIAITGVKGQPKVGYFGATGGGLWKTTDGGDELGADHRRPDHERLGRRGRRLGDRTRTSSSSAWASRASAATSSPATASTSRPTPARRGRTSDSRTLMRSPRSAFIRRIRTSCSSPTSGNTACRAKSAACTRAPTAARRGGRCSYRGPERGAVDISIDPHNPNVMYAAMWEAYRKE